MRDLSRVRGSAWLLLLKSVCMREGVHVHIFIYNVCSCGTEQLFGEYSKECNIYTPMHGL